MEPQRFPVHADMPHQFLVLSIEDALPLIAAIPIGILSGYMLTAVLLGAGLSLVYRRFQERRPRGWVLHWLYWHGVVPLKSLPNPFQRRIYP